MQNLTRGWVITCFGTAVGAGILFLPISAGLSGIWSIVFLTLIILPITYASHRGITRIVASCPKETDIIGAVEYDLGHTAGFIISVLYFLSIVTICVGYATGLTNMVDTLLANRFHIAYISRPLLAFIILVVMTSVMLFNEKIMVLVTSMITLPLILMLLAISIYMIPQWKLSAINTAFDLRLFIKNTLLLLPILIFAMNFSPVCSSLGAFYRRNSSSQDAVKRSDKVVKWTSFILFLFVMFFVFSLFFSITPEILIKAKEQNIDALTAVSLSYNTPTLLYIPQITAFLAIASSYFGHFAGTREGFCGIIMQIITWNNPDLKKKISLQKIKFIGTIMIVALLWCLTVCNLSVLSIIGAVSSPIIAMYAYLMPVILMKRVPRLRIYRSKLSAFVFVVGLVTLVGYFISQIM